jgi:hypothetical protein
MNVSVRIFIIAEVSNFILTTNRLEINIIDYPFNISSNPSGPYRKH